MSENSTKKTMIRQGRQGDVLITKVDRRPDKRLKPIAREHDSAVLAHGEVTGHYHAIKDSNCSLYLDDSNLLTEGDAMSLVMRAGGGATVNPESDRLLRVEEKPVELGHWDEHSQHQPSQDHGHFMIPVGDNEVRRQTEYDPGAEAERRFVAD